MYERESIANASLRWDEYEMRDLKAKWNGTNKANNVIGGARKAGCEILCVSVKFQNIWVFTQRPIIKCSEWAAH